LVRCKFIRNFKYYSVLVYPEKSLGPFSGRRASERRLCALAPPEQFQIEIAFMNLRREKFLESLDAIGPPG
ncbi:MAG: hypothetical protein LBO77_00260, partial [Desulfovibrio sp.]|nr:hypothetical protein [Desulfovibrio sp.]